MRQCFIHDKDECQDGCSSETKMQSVAYIQYMQVYTHTEQQCSCAHVHNASLEVYFLLGRIGAVGGGGKEA